MKTLKELCTPRKSVFDPQKRDTVLDLADLIENRINPDEFFEENWITEGMKTLLEQAFRRLEGKSAQGVMIVEKDAFDLAIEHRLKCDLLEHEERVKPHLRKQVLTTWGIDKASGGEGYITQLKEWTIMALLGVSETIEEEKEYGTNAGEIDFGSRAFEGIGLEESGIG